MRQAKLLIFNCITSERTVYYDLNISNFRKKYYMCKWMCFPIVNSCNIQLIRYIYKYTIYDSHKK